MIEGEADAPPPASRHLEDEVRPDHRLHIPLLGKIAAGDPIPVNPFDSSNPEDWFDLAEGLLGPSNSRLLLPRAGELNDRRQRAGR